MCSGHHAGSTGRAARPRAGHTRYLTFTHTDSPVSRRGPPPGWTPHGCVGAGHHAPPDTVGSTHQASPDDLPQRPRALSDHLRAPGSKRTLSQPVCTRCDEVVRRPMTKSVPLDAPLDGDRHTGALRAQSVAHRDSDFCATVFAAFLAHTPSISSPELSLGREGLNRLSSALSHSELLLITCLPLSLPLKDARNEPWDRKEVFRLPPQRSQDTS